MFAGDAPKKEAPLGRVTLLPFPKPSQVSQTAGASPFWPMTLTIPDRPVRTWERVGSVKKRGHSYYPNKKHPATSSPPKKPCVCVWVGDMVT